MTKMTLQERVDLINKMIEGLHKQYGKISYREECERHEIIEKKVMELNKEFGTQYVYIGQPIAQ